MINKQEFKKMAKDIFKVSKGIQNPQLVHPRREWFIGLFIGLIILGSTIVWSGNRYLFYRNLAVSENVSGKQDIPVYRETLVKEALNSYSERNNEYERLTKRSPVESVKEVVVEPEESQVSSTEETEVEEEVENETRSTSKPMQEEGS
jgi:hypothetical protein